MSTPNNNNKRSISSPTIMTAAAAASAAAKSNTTIIIINRRRRRRPLFFVSSRRNKPHAQLSALLEKKGRRRRPLEWANNRQKSLRRRRRQCAAVLSCLMSVVVVVFCHVIESPRRTGLFVVVAVLPTILSTTVPFVLVSALPSSAHSLSSSSTTVVPTTSTTAATTTTTTTKKKKKSTHNDNNTTTTTTKTSTKNKLLSPPVTKKRKKTGVVQIVETEVYDGTTWRSDEKRKWTCPTTGQVVATPHDTNVPTKTTTTAKTTAPPKWTTVWKIVTGPSRDAHGWEYNAPNPAVMTRRRTWLRTYSWYDEEEEEEPIEAASDDQTKRAPKKQKALAQKKKKISDQQQIVVPPKWIQAIKDDWNFKGFGWTFYKSLVFTKSVGLAIRLPITFNFDTFERNPGFPAISAALCVYYPASIILFWNCSLRKEFLQWAGGRVTQVTAGLLALLAWTLIRGLWVAMAAILYPFTRQWLVPERPVWIDGLLLGSSAAGPHYHRTVDERLGCSLSWRVSAARGYEFRWSAWHFWAPTAVSLWEDSVWGRWLCRRQPKAPAWMRRHAAACGLSTGAPIPDPPYCSSSVIWTMSGYYPLSRQRRQSMREFWKRVVAWRRTGEEDEEEDLEDTIEEYEDEQNGVVNEIAKEKIKLESNSNKKDNMETAAGASKKIEGSGTKTTAS